MYILLAIGLAYLVYRIIFKAVLYGHNGSRYVEVPYTRQDDDDRATVHWGGRYINREGKTYERTRKGYRTNWMERRQVKDE